MESVGTDTAPQAIGPYLPHCIEAARGGATGRIAVDPATMESGGDGGVAQPARVLQNLAAVLKAAGSGLDRVVKTTVYLADMGEFPIMNEEYARHFGDHRPARATVEVARLPKDVRVEIDAIAIAG